MEKNWVKIYSSNDDYQVNLLKILLAENNIESVIINKKDWMYHFGEMELYTQKAEALKASHLIRTELIP